MAKDSPETSDHRPIRRLLRELIQAPAILSIVWPIALMFVGYFAWEKWGADHFARQYYGVDVAKIQVNDPPPLIEAKVRHLVQDVYDDSALDSLSLLDKQASARIASAFSMNHWIRQVVSVRKLPGGKVDVRLAYRQPVAMFHVDCGVDQGFYAVDREGALLPNEDFSSGEVDRYLHIHVPGYCPSSNELRNGEPIPDQRVMAAAHLASYLQPYADTLKLRTIGVVGDPRQNQEPQLEVSASISGDAVDGGRRWHWGSTPGREHSSEATAPMKLEALRKGINNSGINNGSDLRIANRPN